MRAPHPWTCAATPFAYWRIYYRAVRGRRPARSGCAAHLRLHRDPAGSPTPFPGACDSRWIFASRCTGVSGLRDELDRLVRAALQRQSLKGDVRCVWEAPGVSFDPLCVTAVREATAVLGFDSMEMVSGAGHDSCNVSAVVPTSMVFVPCAGGLSHNEAESALPADLEAGANVFAARDAGVGGSLRSRTSWARWLVRTN